MAESSIPHNRWNPRFPADLTDVRFGRLLVTARDPEPYRRPDGKGVDARWQCLCDCGTAKTLRRSDLVSGRVVSCGCFRDQRTSERRRIHGGSRTPEYNIWQGMILRCTHPGSTSYPHYGGRGICVCERWLLSFANFIADMGPRPSPEHSIDRIDNDGGYWCGRPECPDCRPAGRGPNCRWATETEQQRNKSTNRWIEFRGERRTLQEWAEHLGIPRQRISYRLAIGWSVENAFSLDCGRWSHR
jgi:hypothetical protein